ncbi:TonB system transport protein ExbD [Campylobacter insulaenigrae]|uniref:TonB system transport protein ExbD n=1 Tax=Campylobacter insulaenigrae TaxID=260714 RepID=UPI002152435A|nr:TonB system transport protein ExbD [Campylobacter insulaenigrae]MCR6574212.1 TonB system transport protein ExbD [Campylobacter insulaenigrae]MCR6575826.1 TonB system transport protein ExbD [Campylobacter insulaenigrae]MCR6580546.1 TonB system transport protein ExbD [Campylobacter insulaenigrae]MCR6585213.1 TonB system transport protein ExbD [Campylobacter insulaenigrae]MCR6586673.1 TonB system transport protein ExbD [Campylobacter insulaenigrae]
MLKLPKNEGLNIVPFIDIILVLLAIVLSISTFIAHGEIKIELPKSQNSQELSKNENKLTVLIDKENNFYIDEKLASLNDLTMKINSIDSKTLVELKSDKEAKFESFIQIIDILKNKNHENFQITTEQKQ